MKMDKIEAVLLSNLRAYGGRMALTKLSRATGIPVSTLHDRLKKSSRIQKIVPILAFSAMGYNAKAHVMLKANRRYKNELCSYLEQHFNVNNLYKINNGYDYMMECVFKDMRALEEFMEDLDEKFKVRSTTVHYIIHDVKREYFYSDPNNVGDAAG